MSMNKYSCNNGYNCKINYMLLHLKVPFYCTVNPLLSPPGGLFIPRPFEGGRGVLNRDGRLI